MNTERTRRTEEELASLLALNLNLYQMGLIDHQQYSTYSRNLIAHAAQEAREEADAQNTRQGLPESDPEITALVIIEAMRDIENQLEDLDDGAASEQIKHRLEQTAAHVPWAALNQATRDSATQAHTKLRWVTQLDERVCELCEALDGDTYTPEEAPPCPLHVNCRCTLEPV